MADMTYQGRRITAAELAELSDLERERVEVIGEHGERSRLGGPTEVYVDPEVGLIL